MNTLHTFVDGLVGPIVASPLRKRGMREELLGHLRETTAEGEAAGLSPGAAASAAIARLGEPSALRQSLQDSVPGVERWLFWSMIARRDEESDLRYAARLTSFLGSILLVVMLMPVVAGVLAAGLFRGYDAAVAVLLKVLPILMTGFVFASLIIFVAQWLDLRMQRCIAAQRRLASVLHGLLFVASISILCHAMANAMLHVVRDTFLHGLQADVYLATLGIAMLCLVGVSVDGWHRWQRARGAA